MRNVESRLHQRCIINHTVHQAPFVRSWGIQWLAQKQQRAGALMAE
jgi:hypothetical protein